jgi:hypothetical protein
MEISTYETLWAKHFYTKWNLTLSNVNCDEIINQDWNMRQKIVNRNMKIKVFFSFFEVNWIIKEVWFAQRITNTHSFCLFTTGSKQRSYDSPRNPNCWRTEARIIIISFRHKKKKNPFIVSNKRLERLARKHLFLSFILDAVFDSSPLYTDYPLLGEWVQIIGILGILQKQYKQTKYLTNWSYILSKTRFNPFLFINFMLRISKWISYNWTFSNCFFLRTKKICARITDAKKNKRPWTRNGSWSTI